MNILVISGGSGNDSLIKGLVRMYPQATIKVLLNAYDNGKSTGVCRYVTDTLGVSDIRKNHIRMYKERTPQQRWNKNYIDFYSKRFDLTPGKEYEEVCQHLVEWNLEDLCKYATRFFNRVKSRNIEYKDFSISNIIYAEMYAEIGYDDTNTYFTDMLDIEDFVVFNSYDNVYIDAITESGAHVGGEEHIVEWNNSNDLIKKLTYNVRSVSEWYRGAEIEIEAADLIVMSSGTFWASLYPTLEYKDLYKSINKSRAKKIWVMNNVPDFDCIGVNSLQLIDYASSILDMSQWTILENSDAVDEMKLYDSKYDIRILPMGNSNGKHDPILLATCVFSIYYNLKFVGDLFFDFDDTLWPRKGDEAIGIDNLRLVNQLKQPVVIVTGNTWASMESKIGGAIGSIYEFHPDVWADVNSRLVCEGNTVTVLDYLAIDNSVMTLVDLLIDKYGLPVTINNISFAGSQIITCIKIKPLNQTTRVLLLDLLNNYLIPLYAKDANIEARITGTTTVDIVNKSNNKVEVLDYYDSDTPVFRTYIGDEIDSGNDVEIAEACTNSIHVQDAYETNLILRILTNSL